MNGKQNSVISLQELQSGIKEALQFNFSDYVWVHAELNEVNIARNGHCYIELIEKQNNQIVAKTRATIWNFTFRMLKPYFESATGYEFTSGIKVSLKAIVEFHEVYGLSLNIKDIDPNFTVGDVELQKRRIINQLDDDGILDMNAELGLPLVIQNIAVISSPTAAGYGDWKNQIDQNIQGFRFNYKLFEAKMQGQDTGASVISALDKIYEKEALFDAVVIIRGGGSKMDLAGFDDYDLAANLAQFPLPIITGIGHERDESIADIVAHTSLKTPTAVADFLIDNLASFEEKINRTSNNIVNLAKEMLEGHNHELEMAIQNLHQNTKFTLKRNNDILYHSTKQILRETHSYNIFAQEKLNHFSEKLSYESLRIIRRRKEYIKEIQVPIPQKISAIVLRQERRINHLNQLNNALNPKHVIERGFAIIEQANKIVSSIKKIQKDQEIKIIMKDGEISVLKE